MLHIFKLFFIFLGFIRLDYAFASSVSGEDLSEGVRKTRALGQEIHDTADISKAQSKADILRKKIGNASGTYILNRAEKKVVIKAIAQAETAMMLVDGNYNFHFMSDYVLGTSCSAPQQTHRATVFAIARASQILVENRNATNTDIKTLIQRDLNSRHMPHWMRDAYARSKMLKSFDYRAELFDYTSLESLPLANKKLEERAAEQRSNTRPKFKITLQERHKEDVKKAHQDKGLPFAEDAFSLGFHVFEAFAIRPDGACAFYGCQGPYGYFNRKDFGEQIIDNIDTDSTLEKYALESIINLIRFHRPELADRFLPGFPIDKFDFQTQDLELLADNKKHSKAQENFVNTYVKPEFKKVLTAQKVKEIADYDISSSVKTGFERDISYVDLMAYLNNLNIYQFSLTKHAGAGFKLFTSSLGDTIYFNQPNNFHVSNPTARKTFLVGDDDHVTRLVPVENTVENLIEWVKAKIHEERRGTRIDAGYKRAWMKGARFNG